MRVSNCWDQWGRGRSVVVQGQDELYSEGKVRFDLIYSE